MDWTPSLRADVEASGGGRPPPGMPAAAAAETADMPATDREPASEREPRDFSRFYTEQWPAAVRLAVGLVDERARAEELAQDAFEKVLLRWERLDHPAAYLRACVVNGARSELRRRRVLRRHSRAGESSPDGVAHDVILWDALDTLPARHRAALVMRFWLDLPDDEIAASLGVRPATVRSLVFRGLRDLRKVVER